jgi:cystathionine beta-lyase
VEQWDALTAQELRARGSLKWTRFDGDMIGAFVAEMDFGTAPAVVSALHAAVDQAMFGYPPPVPAGELARACAHWQRERYGWTVAPECVLPVSDVLTALELALRHFDDARPRQRHPGPPGGRPLIVPTPAYMPFLTLPPLHGRKVIEVPMIPADGAGGRRRYTLDLDGIDRAFRDGGHLLVLCNPANPVGRVFTAEELAEVTVVVDRHGGRVFADEVHAPLTYPGQRHLPYASTSPTAAAHTVTATSASKAWNLPGLKCAQVIVDPAELEAWQRVAAPAPVTASTLGMVANTAAYRAGAAWLDSVLGYLDRNRRALAELLETHLPEVGYRPPEGTYLAWLDCRWLAGGAGPLDAYFQQRAGVAVVDGVHCGEAGRGHVRLNFATPLPILERIVTRMAHAATVHGEDVDMSRSGA